MTDPEFLDVDDVIALQDEQLGLFGGQAGIRDRGLLESAVAVPQASFGGEYLHADLFEMAAAYAFHIAENQPFIDGNKRTAIVSALVFLRLNGIVIPEATSHLYAAMIDIAAHRLEKTSLAQLFRQLAQPLENEGIE